MCMCLKDADWMASSVDQFNMGLQYTVYPDHRVVTLGGKVTNYRDTYIDNENRGNYRWDLKVILDRDSSES